MKLPDSPQEMNASTRVRVRLFDGSSLHKVACVCWLISLALLIRVAWEPRFDQEIGTVASLTGLTAIVAVSLAPRRPWSFALGATGVLLVILPPMFIRA